MNTGRLIVRLPTAMLRAMKWTAERDRVPLSTWVRDVLNANTYGVAIMKGTTPVTEELRDGSWRKIARRTASEDAEGWKGGRIDKTAAIRFYRDLDGNAHAGSLPGDPLEQMQQDHWIERQQARSELETWLKRWGREGKTLRLQSDELRMAKRLLAKFDRDPK